ncbi:MAG: hypothetical protein JHD15_10880 [Phenylobacterium sp.]|uniref:hypothetical protein n=1 Tax=Phenylobacterium sp. TaxID=1871053 RepID=UPI001A32A62A|nr:hypothetical protein [Phenylobacterium sp.]MBJ7410847.1 hypothetical protein [Phenylobacterium sp.]
MKPLISMREALADPQLLGGAMPGDSWRTWRTYMIAGMGEALTDEERVVFKALTGREREPLTPVEELWAIVGRRGGKTRAAGTLAAYVGTLCDHTEYLAPGERGVIPILAATADQAGRAFMHARGVLEHSPALSDMIDGEPTSDTIRLTSAIDVVVKPANFKTIRGITAVAAICDEVAFWMIEGTVNPDAEILEALRPSLGTTGGPMMVISSAYAKRGEVYGTYRRDYGPNGDPAILVAHAPTRSFNPTFPQAKVDRAIARDAAKARAEYLSEFRDDVSGFVTREVVEACVSPGVRERGFITGFDYRAFVDPSGGVNDAMTLAIAHREGETGVLDAVRERKAPFSPEAVVADFCDLLKRYGISRVTGDRYAGEWPREQFRKHGVEYEVADKPRSDLYRDLLPALNSVQVDLLDVDTIATQLCSLERRVARGGRESIDHPPNGHDDLANAVAGVLVNLTKVSGYVYDLDALVST